MTRERVGSDPANADQIRDTKTARGTTRASVTWGLLACGAVAGPLFIGVVLVQDYTRPGVEPREQPLSLLTLGDLGWIQIANFVVAGLLNLAYAVGIRRALHPGPAGTWGPSLIGAYGLGLITAGVFVPDPAFGFPPGTPHGVAGQASWHGNLHAIGALIVFGSLIPATFVFTRRFAARREWVWALCCAATGVAVLVFFISSSKEEVMSVSLRAAAALGWGWASVLAIRLMMGSVARNQAYPHDPDNSE